MLYTFFLSPLLISFWLLLLEINAVIDWLNNTFPVELKAVHRARCRFLEMFWAGCVYNPTLLKRETQFMSDVKRRGYASDCGAPSWVTRADFDGTFIAFKGVLLRLPAALACVRDTFRRSVDSTQIGLVKSSHAVQQLQPHHATTTPNVWPPPWSWPKYL